MIVLSFLLFAVASSFEVGRYSYGIEEAFSFIENESYLLKINRNLANNFDSELKNFRILNPQFKKINYSLSPAEDFVYAQNVIITIICDLTITINNRKHEIKDFLYEMIYKNVAFEIIQNKTIINIHSSEIGSFFFSKKNSFLSLSYFDDFTENFNLQNEIKKRIDMIIIKHMKSILSDKTNLLTTDFLIIENKAKEYYNNRTIGYIVDDFNITHLTFEGFVVPPNVVMYNKAKNYLRIYGLQVNLNIIYSVLNTEESTNHQFYCIIDSTFKWNSVVLNTDMKCGPELVIDEGTLEIIAKDIFFKGFAELMREHYK